MTPESQSIVWAPRVRPSTIRRLYELDAKGIRDEGLIDEVGYAMLARCESIHRVTHRLCPFCGGRLVWSPPADHPIHCTACGWQSTWGRYHRSYKGRRIHGGRAFPAFEAFLEQFPRARTPEQKMIAIDTLIHAVHCDATGIFTSPAASNLIEGKLEETIRLLCELAAGPESAAGAAARKAAMLADIRRSESVTREHFERRGKTMDLEGFALRWAREGED